MIRKERVAARVEERRAFVSLSNLAGAAAAKEGLFGCARTRTTRLFVRAEVV
jgi:hypothetical protein